LRAAEEREPQAQEKEEKTAASPDHAVRSPCRALRLVPHGSGAPRDNIVNSWEMEKPAQRGCEAFDIPDSVRRFLKS
jgi:hypothetical protein